MINHNFEIKVALLGHVSVGKTTVLNALFQEKFSEVSKRRNTAGINHFRVSIKNYISPSKNAKSVNSDAISSTHFVRDIKSSKETLSQTTNENSKLREQNIIKETLFDIQLDHDLIKMREDTQLCMIDIPGINEAHSSDKYREYVVKLWDSFDCVVVVMDAMQGVNTEEQVKLLQFVKKCMKEIRDQPLIVLCNKVDDPEDKDTQVLVSEVRAEVERVFKVKNRTSALECILSNVNKNEDNSKNDHDLSPAFIPVSAGKAFLYRAASRLSLDQFKNFDRDFVDEIGREEFGRHKWKKLSSTEQYEEVFKIVSDPDEYKERLAESNFDKFLSILEYFLGGVENQLKLLSIQMDIMLSKITFMSNISDELTKVYYLCMILDMPTNHLQDTFWKVYKQCEQTAFEKLSQNPFHIKDLQKPMNELIIYQRNIHAKIHATQTGSNEKRNSIDEHQVINSMKKLVKKMCNLVIKRTRILSLWETGKWFWDGENWNVCKFEDGHPDVDLAFYWRWEESRKRWIHVITGHEIEGKCDENPAIAQWEWNSSSHSKWFDTINQRTNDDETRHPAGNLSSHWVWNNSIKKWVHTITKFEKDGLENENPALSTWADISPVDKNAILTSILFMAQNIHFHRHFGAEIVQLNWIKLKPVEQWQLIENCISGQIKEGKFVPKNPTAYEYLVRLPVPESIESPDHWGHIPWMFCEFMESISLK